MKSFKQYITERKSEAEKLLTWAKKNLKYTTLEITNKDDSSNPDKWKRIFIHSIDDNFEPAGFFVYDGESTFQFHPVWISGSRGQGFQTTHMKKKLKDIDKEIYTELKNQGSYALDDMED